MIAHRHVEVHGIVRNVEQKCEQNDEKYRQTSLNVRENIFELLRPKCHQNFTNSPIS